MKMDYFSRNSERISASKQSRMLPVIAAFLLSVPSSVKSESVDVKYWGEVDLGPYDCADTVSSFVHRICYCESKQHIVVLLNDTYYAYCRVAAQTAEDWKRAGSKGRYYNRNVKNAAVNEVRVASIHSSDWK